MYRLRKIVITLMLFLTGAIIGYAGNQYFSVREFKEMYAEEGLYWVDVWFGILRVYLEAYIVAMLVGTVILICSKQYEKRKGR